MNSIDLFFSDEEDDFVPNLAIMRRRVRDASNPMELPTWCFQKSFRLSKEAFQNVLEQISPHLKKCVHSVSVPPILKLAAFLRFCSEDSYQTGVGNDFNLGISQPTFSKMLNQLLCIFEEHVCPNWIRFEMSTREKDEAKFTFYEKTGFPGVIGCVDGTNIRIITPGKDIQHLYYNRKGFHSINALLVCDHKMRIRCVDAKYPGSCHDALVWAQSDLRQLLIQKHSNGERNSWLLDSGYPLEPIFITPFRSAVEGSIESSFNMVHSRTRNIIERTIGVLKNRFRCILGARELHYKPAKTTKIINACCALHNICICYNVEQNELDESEELPTAAENTTGEYVSENAIAIRNNIMNSINYE